MSILTDLAVDFPEPGTFDHQQASALMPDIFYVTKPNRDDTFAWRPSMAEYILMSRLHLLHRAISNTPSQDSVSGHSQHIPSSLAVVTLRWDGQVLHFQVRMPYCPEVSYALTPVTDRVKNEIVRRAGFLVEGKGYTLDDIHLLAMLAAASREECVAAWVEVLGYDHTGAARALNFNAWLREVLHAREKLRDASEPLRGNELEVFCTLGLDNWGGTLDELYAAARALSAK